MSPIYPTEHIFIISLSIISSIFFGSQFIPQKLAGKVKTDYYNFSMVLGINIGSITGFFLFSLIIGFKEIYILPVIFSFIAGFFWSFANKLSLVGINNIGMAMTSVILNLVSIFSFIFGVFLFSESTTIFQYLGIPILMFGAILVARLTESGSKLNIKGVLSVFFATIFISIDNALITKSINPENYPVIPSFVAIMFKMFGASLAALMFNLTSTKLREWKNQPKKIHLYAIGGGLTWLCGFEISAHILELSGLAITVPIIQSVVTLVSSLWGILYFKEIKGKRKLLQFIIGAAITGSGVLLFSL